MPTLSSWDPRPAILHWLNKSQHKVRDCPKRKEEEYFRGVFEEASEFENESKDDIEVGSSLKGKAKEF